MKACIQDKAPDMSEDKDGKFAAGSEAGAGLRRRARRIIKTKIYFIFHDREDGKFLGSRLDMIKFFPAEVLILFVFIISIFLLSILLTCQSLSGRLDFYVLMDGIKGFMAVAFPVISIVASASLGLMALNGLAKYYIKKCNLLQR
jgi:hypothetical protein